MTVVAKDFHQKCITPQNGQRHSNNSSAKADDLFECVRPFCGAAT